MTEINNKKRSVKDEVGQFYLSQIRKYQRASEDDWANVRLYELKLKDYLNGVDNRTELDYANAIKDINWIETVSDEDLVQELISRIGQPRKDKDRKFALLIRGLMTRDLNFDKEGLVEIELDGEDDEESIELV